MGITDQTFKEIVAVLKLILKSHDTNVEIIQTGDFTNCFCGNLDLDRDIQRAATGIEKKGSRSEFGSRKISDIAGVVEVTIKQSYKLMIPKARKVQAI